MLQLFCYVPQCFCISLSSEATHMCLCFCVLLHGLLFKCTFFYPFNDFVVYLFLFLCLPFQYGIHSSCVFILIIISLWLLGCPFKAVSSYRELAGYDLFGDILYTLNCSSHEVGSVFDQNKPQFI
jgi:hypothetical protein